MPSGELDDEVDRNYDAFVRSLNEYLPLHQGQHALLRHGKVEGFLQTAGLALAEGLRRFSDGMFSIQEVTDRPVDLGFFSHAVDSRRS